MSIPLICGGAGGPNLLAGCGGGGAGSSIATASLIAAIAAAGETANLQLCLDAADINSYNGSGAFKDVSGNGRDFTNTDGLPFNGTPGGLSGNEYFTVNAAASRTLQRTGGAWADTLMQANSLSTILMSIYVPTGNSFSRVFSSGGGGDSCATLIECRHQGTGETGTEKGQLTWYSSTGACNSLVTYFKSEVPGCGWMVLAMSYDEAIGNGFHFANGAYAPTLLHNQGNAGAVTYNPPQDTFDPDYWFYAPGNTGTPLRFGGEEIGLRVQNLAIWTGRRLNLAGLQAIYGGIKGRYGL